MPPKRKSQDEISSGSESEVVIIQRPSAAVLLPEVMRNIEMLKSRREGSRKKINAGFNAYIAAMKKEIGEHYAAQATKRSAEAKSLLTHYVEALEQRASIEKSIEELVMDARQDLKELAIVLEAAYSGRQEQCNAAAGSFASIEPVSVKDATVDKSVFDMQTNTQTNKTDENFISEAKPQNGEQERDNIFDQISW
ncbi:hypothetical protein GGS24DRAFT_463596 [Hypoxylon argillaceum]|nr:hypothetical protein GGS24DRAFT_463596 [Hypoxylon argillaceum]